MPSPQGVQLVTTQSTGQACRPKHGASCCSAGQGDPRAKAGRATDRARIRRPASELQLLEQTPQCVQLDGRQSSGHAGKLHSIVSDSSGQLLPEAAWAITMNRERLDVASPHVVAEHAESQELHIETIQSCEQTSGLHRPVSTVDSGQERPVPDGSTAILLVRERTPPSHEAEQLVHGLQLVITQSYPVTQVSPTMILNGAAVTQGCPGSHDSI